MPAITRVGPGWSQVWGLYPGLPHESGIQLLESPLYCRRGWVLAGSCNQEQRQVSNLGILIWDMGIPGGVLTTAPNACPCPRSFHPRRSVNHALGGLESMGPSLLSRAHYLIVSMKPSLKKNKLIKGFVLFKLLCVQCVFILFIRKIFK